MLSDKEVGELWVESGRKAELPIVYELRLQMRHLIAKLVEERAQRDCQSIGDMKWKECHAQGMHTENVLRDFHIPPDEFRAWQEKQR